MLIEVAVLLPPFGFYVPEDVVARAQSDVPWSDRAQVTVEVREDVTVGEVLDQAADLLGIYPGPYPEPLFPRGTFEVPHGVRLGRTSGSLAGVSFFRDDPSEGRSKGGLFYPIVAADGVVVWDRRITDVPITDLLRTADAGVLQGDPRRLYLVPQASAGAGGGLDWNAVLLTAQAIQLFLSGLDSTLGGVERLRAGFQAVRGVLGRHSAKWAARGGGFADVVLLADEEWSSDQLSKLLTAPETDIEILLQWLGRSEQSDGTWQVGMTDEHAAVRAFAWATRWLAFMGLCPGDGEYDESKAVNVLVEIADRLQRGEHLTEDDVYDMVALQANPDYSPG